MHLLHCQLQSPLGKRGPQQKFPPEKKCIAQVPMLRSPLWPAGFLSPHFKKILNPPKEFPSCDMLRQPAMYISWQNDERHKTPAAPVDIARNKKNKQFSVQVERPPVHSSIHHHVLPGTLSRLGHTGARYPYVNGDKFPWDRIC